MAFTGTTVAVSGQVPVDGDGRLVGEGVAEAHVRHVYANLATALEAASCTLDDVVKLTVYLTDLADLPAFRRVRDEHQDARRPTGLLAGPGRRPGPARLPGRDRGAGRPPGADGIQ